MQRPQYYEQELPLVVAHRRMVATLSDDVIRGRLTDGTLRGKSRLPTFALILLLLLVALIVLVGIVVYVARKPLRRWIRFSLGTLLFGILAIGSSAAMVLKWYPWEAARSFEVEDVDPGSHLDISPDGSKFVLVRDGDEQLSIRDVESGEVRSVHDLQNLRLTGARFGPAGRSVLVFGRRQISRLDLESGTLTEILPEQKERSGPQNEVLDVSRDGKHALVKTRVATEFPGGGSGYLSKDPAFVRVLSIPDGREKFNVNLGQPQSVTGVFSRSSTRIAVSNGSTLHVWDWSSGRKLGETTHFTHKVDFAPNHEHVVVAPSYGDLAIWNIAANETSRHWPTEPNTVATFNPNGRELATTAGLRRVNRKVRVTISKRLYPEWWWGMVYLPEFWLALVFSLALCCSLWRDRRHFRIMKEKAAMEQEAG